MHRRRRHARADLARAARRDREHLRVELPLLRRRQRVRAGAAGGQRGALQAVRVRDAHRAARSARCCTRRACRRTCSRAGRRRRRRRCAAARSRSTACSSRARTPPARRIAASRSARMIKVQLELGGKDPIYVCEDVDVAAAAAALADGAIYNTGQSCCSVERIYVHAVDPRRIRRRRSSPKSAGFEHRRPTLDETYIGPLTRAPQLQVLERQVADAVAKGARVLVGGKRIDAAGQLVRADGAGRRRPRDGGDARRELRPDHRHPEGRRRRRGGAADERQRLRPDRGRLHAAAKRARSASSRACRRARSTGTAAIASARACRGAASSSRASA